MTSTDQARPAATHLVTGVAGQDGIHLARLLLRQGIRVFGTARLGSAETAAMAPYLRGVELRDLDVRDTDRFATIIDEVRPDVVHNLAAMSSVGASWDEPELAAAVNHTAVVGMLSTLRGSGVRFIQASSSEIFGPVEVDEVDETAPLNPVSPYAETKAAAHVAVVDARASGDVAASNLVLFGHTSVLHATRFVLRTISRQAAEVARGTRSQVSVQDPSVRRDWGSAPDFVRAIAAAAQAEPDDFVIATGVLHQLGEIVSWAAAAAGIDDAPSAAGSPSRPNDFGGVRGNSAHAAERLGWKPSVALREEVSRMVRVDLQRLDSGVEEDAGYLD
jgi:GDPmannose 4,6-dehydratase